LDEVRLGSRTLQPGRQLLAGGRREPLGKRALDILSMLAEARGEIVTKDELLDAVWPGVTVEENALQVHIVALRKALGPEADRLKTIRSVGYQLDIDMQLEPAADRAAVTPVPVIGPARLDQARTAAMANPRGLNVAAMWASARRHRWAIGLMALLVVLAGAWTQFGDDVGLRQQERIPVVVRALAASGKADRTEAALAGGITDELIVRLRRLPELRIATAEADGRVPADSFKRAYIVDGSIRSSGDRLRVTARLSDADGEILWSETFDRGIADLFEVQEAIAASISDALGVSLDVGANSAAYGGTDNPEAFAAYLEYKAHVFDQDQSVAVRHLERALALDPDYIKALAALSTSFGVQSNLAATRERALALLAKMDNSTARALAADPDLWIGHAARGNYYNERKDYAAAAASFRRVEELDQGIDPELRNFLASYALLNGRAREALSLLDSNEAIDPITRNDPIRVWALASLGRHEEAIELFEKLSANDPISAQQYARYVVMGHLQLGHKAKAIQFAEHHDVAMDRFDAHDEGLTAMSRQELRQWATRRFGEGGKVQIVGAAQDASLDGHPKLALDLLRLALEKPGGYGINSLWFPTMANARRTAGFEKFVTDLGLVRFWRESGQWPDACRPVSATDFTCN